MHVCPIILVAISTATTLQACSLLSSSSSSPKPQLFPFFHFSFNMKFMAASVLPPEHWGRKKSKGERINIYSMFMFSKSMLQIGELWCVCIVCERIRSGTAAGEIMEDQETVFGDKLSSGKLQLYCRKWYLRLQLICESHEGQITDSPSGLQNLIYKNLGLSRRWCVSVICISIPSPPQPLNLPAALSQWKFLFSVCSKYMLKKNRNPSTMEVSC